MVLLGEAKKSASVLYVVGKDKERWERMVVVINEDDGSVLKVAFAGDDYSIKKKTKTEDDASYIVVPGFQINEIFEGDFLMIRGNGNVVRGIGCYVDGDNNECHGDGTHICGDGNYCVGEKIWVKGHNNTIKAAECCVEGYGNIVSLLLHDDEEEECSSPNNDVY